MKCKCDVVVGTHPEDIALCFFFCATSVQINLKPWGALESNTMWNVQMFYVCFKIKLFIFKKLDLFQTGGV